MATNTTNLSLIKPDLTDKIRIAQINQNMDIIDEKLGPVGSTSLQSQVTPLTTKTANYDKLIENGTDLNSLLTTGVYKSPATAAGVHTLLNCPVETPFVMVVRGEGEVDGCVQLLCGGVSIYTRRGTGSGFPAEWTVPTGGATPSGEYTIDDLYDAIDELLANAKDEIVSELVDDTAGEGDTGKVWSADKLATSFDEKANIDGYYEEMTVGSSEQLISTVSVQDSAPYVFRTSGGNADIGDREVDKLIGGTIAWNQLIENGNFGSTSGWYKQFGNISVSENICTYTFTEVQNNDYGNNIYQTKPIVSGHKYFFCVDYLPKYDGRFALWTVIGTNTQYAREVTGNIWNKISIIFNGVAASRVQLSFFGKSDGYSANDTVSLRKCVLFDLTQMFGSTIADYIYSLEQATAGAGVAWFKRYFQKPYYAYNAGELMSVKALSHDTVGFNAWDEEWEVGGVSNITGALYGATDRIRSKNYIPCFPSTAYYINTPAVLGTVAYYDSEKNFVQALGNINAKVITTPSNAHYMKFCTTNIYGATYKNDICINLSWDGERDGEYEPYEKHSYSLGDVELRGVPKLDAENHLQYNGDTYESDGTVTRKYGIVDLGTLTWILGSAGHFYAKVTGVVLYKPIDPQMLCDTYKFAGARSSAPWYGEDKEITCYFVGSSTVRELYISDSAYTDVADFKTAMSGVYLVYELATPTIETTDSFQNPQIVNDFGTEEYVDRGVATSSRDVAIPVGHETQYQVNLRAKLEMAPDSPADGDGEYVVRQTNGTNEYIKWNNSEIAEAIDAVEEAKEDKNVSAPAIIDTASGAIASFPDGADNRPLVHCIAQINPVQDLHGYDNPWPAGGWKNKLEPIQLSSLKSLNPSWTWNNNVASVNGVNVEVVVKDDIPTGEYKVTGTSTATTNFYINRMEASDFAGMILNGIPSGTVSQWEMYYALQSSPYTSWGYDLGNGVTLKDSASGVSLLVLHIKNGKTFNNAFAPMIRPASVSDATFAPYSNICPITGWTGAKVTVSPTTDEEDGTTYDITFPSEAGTVYGGTLDVVTGVLTVDRAIYNAADISWNIDKTAKRIYKVLPEIVPASSNYEVAEGLMCNRFASITLNDIYTGIDGIAISGGSALQFRISGLTDDPNVRSAGINEYLTTNPTMVVAKIATPITYQLTPQEVRTLLGQNNIFADTGDTSVSYRADTKLYIDKKFAELQAALNG